MLPHLETEVPNHVGFVPDLCHGRCCVGYVVTPLLASADLRLQNGQVCNFPELLSQVVLNQEINGNINQEVENILCFLAQFTFFKLLA